MASDRAKHNILPVSKFGLVQITRQRVRPVMNIVTTETCPVCYGKGKISSSLLFTDTLEHKIDYLVTHLKTKKFFLYVHPFVYAFICQGFPSLKWRWKSTYSFSLKVVPDQNLGLLEYRFVDTDGDEIDMKEEQEIK